MADAVAPRDWLIRLADVQEFDVLAAVEIDAFASLAAHLGVNPQTATATPRHLIEQAWAEKLLFVACPIGTNAPMGFVAALERDDCLYVGEVDVMVAWQRRGVGRALMHRALDEIGPRRLRGAVLNTDRHVPFNAPFYQTLGFRELNASEAPPSLQAVRAAEIKGGADPARRVMMAYGF